TATGPVSMNSRSIVYKTRLYVVVILGLLSLAIFTEWNRLTALRKDVAKLSDRTAPLLTTTGDLARVSSTLRSVSETVRAADTSTKLDGLRHTLGTLMDEADQLLERGVFPDPILHTTAQTFAPLLDAQDRVITAREAVSRNTLIALDALNAMSKELLPDHQALMLAVLEVERGGQILPPEMQGIDDLLMISEMKVSIARLSILTSNLGNPAGRQPESIRAHVIQEISILASRMARLNEGELRSKTARQLTRYRDAMIAPGGVMHSVEWLGRAATERDKALADASRFVATVSTSLGAVSHEAAQGFQTAADDTAKTIRGVLWQKLFLTLTLVVVVSFFAWSIIERGLVSRLSRVAAHVRELAQGNLSSPVVVTALDEVGEIEQAVERSRTMAGALQRTNDELERFVYVAAHDLRTPLRAVSDLVQWTQEDYAPALPGGARDNLDLIEGRVTRLSNHLTALLDYARAGQTNAKTDVLDLDEFVQEMRAVYLENNHFDLVVSGDFRRLRTYPTPVKTMLLNLISNSVKHHDRTIGRIEVSCTPAADHIALKVHDDGPGIPPEYHERIFVLFQTLRSRDSVESTGLGLAMVQKLAVSLGGNVEVDSRPEQRRGTTFTIRLPLTDAGQTSNSSDPSYGRLAA
ncbi:MAG: HAMP domain-containing sensor histidine kinase, partial [Pseudomonadota bacterium]